MANEAGSPVMDLVVKALEKDRKATFADVKAAAEKKGLTVYPITYGRAKALLGLVPSAKRGEGKAARASAGLTPKRGPGRPRKDGSPAQPRTGKRGPGRPPKSSYGEVRRGPGRPRRQSSPLDTLDALVSEMRQSERSTATYRAALEKALEVINGALSS